MCITCSSSVKLNFHYVTRSIEEALLKKEIPYTIYSGVQFFGRMEIKDALCYLRMIAYQDDLSFARVVNRPKRNMGERRMAFLREMADAGRTTLYEALVRYLDNDIFKGTKARQFVDLIERFRGESEGRPVSEILSAILDESGYELALRTEGSQERLDNLAELKQSVYLYETTCGEETGLEDYLRHAALFSNADADDGTGDRVRLMTVHTAKGLEFPYVFLCGMNEGIFPSRKTRTLQAMEEERRLAFVALTRAQKGLCLSEAQGRNFDGSPRYPSRFVLDIDPALISFVPDMDENLLREAKAHIRKTERWMEAESEENRLREGDRVRQGQLLARLDAKDYQLQVNAVQIQYDPVKAEVERLRLLFEGNSLSANDYEKAASGLEQHRQHHQPQGRHRRRYLRYCP